MISSGKIYAKELHLTVNRGDKRKNSKMEIESAERFKLAHGVSSTPTKKKNLTYWDKEGGLDGLCIWIVNDFLGVK